MSLKLLITPGADTRDEPGGSARSLALTFAVVEPGQWAMALDIHTGWMARPLLYERSGAPPQPRRRLPGTDGPRESSPSASVHLCVPIGAEHEHLDWQGPRVGEPPCPHLGVPCKAHAGYTIADAALVSLITGGEPELEAWLRATAANWLDPKGDD